MVFFDMANLIRDDHQFFPYFIGQEGVRQGHIASGRTHMPCNNFPLGKGDLSGSWLFLLQTICRNTCQLQIIKVGREIKKFDKIFDT